MFMFSKIFRSFAVAQWVSDLALLLLWLRFDPWPWELHAVGLAKKKVNKKIKKKVNLFCT